MTEFKNMYDDPELVRKFALWLVHLFEDSCHMRDSALQVIQSIPDWQQRYREALDNPLRQQHTHELVDPLRTVVDALFRGEVTDALLDGMRAKMSKLPN